MHFTFTTTGRSTVTTKWGVELEVSDLLAEDLESAVNSALQEGRATAIATDAEPYDQHELDHDSIEAG